MIEQISYLLFIKRLDDLELDKEKQAQRLKRSVKDPIFSGKDDPRRCRWSYFKDLDNKEVAYEEVQYEPPKVILQKLRAIEDEIRADLDALEVLLSQDLCKQNAKSGDLEEIPARGRHANKGLKPLVP